MVASALTDGSWDPPRGCLCEKCIELASWSKDTSLSIIVTSLPDGKMGYKFVASFMQSYDNWSSIPKHRPDYENRISRRPGISRRPDENRLYVQFMLSSERCWAGLVMAMKFSKDVVVRLADHSCMIWVLTSQKQYSVQDVCVMYYNVLNCF